MITNLENEIKPLLLEAKEIFIATALINKPGYEFLKTYLNKDSIRNFIIGIDLPSTPSVLEELMKQNEMGVVNARIFKSDRTYHPKVYVVQTVNDDFSAFIGSANTTAGGLSRNIEMSLRVDSKAHCEQLINWFKQLYDQSFIITQDFLNIYTKTYKSIKVRQAANYADLTAVHNKLKKKDAQLLDIPPSQYFNANDFAAYSEPFWYDYNENANDNRKQVKEKLKQLHYTIYEAFEDYGLHDLYCHPHTQNIVSSHIYRAGFNRSKLDAIWLHYGYSSDELNGTKLLDHPRIQVILRNNYIGVWLVIGKDNGSEKERNHLTNQLNDSAAFKKLFFQEIKNLGGAYWIETNGESEVVNNFDSEESLNDFVQDDEITDYFIIGRDYDPADSTLSKDNIAETILMEFQRLYPVYLSLKI